LLHAVESAGVDCRWNTHVTQALFPFAADGPG